jgi:hypothetical protein
VVDKMSLTRAERAGYIVSAKRAGFKIVGYFFQSQLAAALQRNARRDPAEPIPDAGLGGASAALELPSHGEGFDELFFVRMDGQNGFVVEEWKDVAKQTY